MSRKGTLVDRLCARYPETPRAVIVAAYDGGYAAGKMSRRRKQEAVIETDDHSAMEPASWIRSEAQK